MRASFAIPLFVLAPAALTPAFAEVPSGETNGSGRPPALEFTLGDVSLQLSGRAQLQAALWVGDDARLSNGQAAEEMGFRLRRARFGVGIEFKGLEVVAETDLLESEGTALHEAFVGWAGTWGSYGFHTAAGLVKAPMSRTAGLSSESVQQAEKSIVTRSLAPEQQLGLTVQGDFWDERVRLEAGVFNGMERGTTFASGWARIDPKVGNRFGGWAVSARLDVEPLPNGSLLGDGVADLGKRDKPAFGFGGGFLYNDGGSITSTAWSADLAFKGWGVGFLAEFIELTTAPQDEPTAGASQDALEITSRGMTGQLGYTIIKDHLEVSVRVDWFDRETRLDNEGDFIGIGGAVSGYLFDGRLKLQFDYEHRNEQHGSVLENDVFMAQAEGRF